MLQKDLDIVQEYHFVGAESSVLNRFQHGSSRFFMPKLGEKIEDTDEYNGWIQGIYSEAALKIAQKRNDLFGYAFAGLQLLDVKSVMFHNNTKKFYRAYMRISLQLWYNLLLKIHWQEVHNKSLKKGWLTVL